MRIATCANEAAGERVRASNSASAIFFTMNQFLLGLSSKPVKRSELTIVSTRHYGKSCAFLHNELLNPEDAPVLERFSNTYVLTDSIEGGFYFHPSDEDLSLGTPLRKKPLCGVVSVYCNWRTAIAGRAAVMMNP